MLAALKPRGEPMIEGSGGSEAPAEEPRRDPDKAAESPTRLVVARLYHHTGGSPREATLTLDRAITRAWRANLLEEPEETIPLAEGVLALRLAPFETQTLLLEIPAEAAVGHQLGAQQEAVQPVYLRFWRHNRGCAPLGFLPVTLRLNAVGTTEFKPGGASLLRATVASSLRDRRVGGSVTVEVPEGWGASVSVFRFELEPGGLEQFEVVVDAPPQAEPGVYRVLAYLDTGDGQRYYDACEVSVGPSAEAPLSASWGCARIIAAPGGQATLVLQLSNASPQTIFGEAILCSPFETWTFLGPRSVAFAVPGRGRAEVRFQFCPPEDCEPGHYWAMAKVAYGSRLYYTEAVDLEVG